jgi:tyrosine-specific transport protein
VPAITAPIGVLPSAAGLLATWTFLVLAGLAYVEAAGAVMSRAQGSRAGASEAGGGASFLSLSRPCFGGRVSGALSALFLIQMIVLLTANLVKAAQLCTTLMPSVQYVSAVWVAAVGVGTFVLASTPLSIAAVNTALTGAMCVGFVALFAAAMFFAPRTAAPLLSHAKWGALLPQSGWVIPVFANTLRFGEAIPVVVGHLGRERLGEARTAVVLGSLLPLLLAIGWSAASLALAPVATAALGASAADPVLALLHVSKCFAMPVTLIAIGAIGSTLIGLILASSQLLGDAFRSEIHLRWRTAARTLMLVLPALFACLGPGSYMPLIAFSGAFPTTVLYGLVPPVAALVLRWKNRRAGESMRAIVPGGRNTLVGLSLIACSLLGINLRLLY